MRRFWIGVTVTLIGVAVSGGIWWALGAQTALPLNAQEQAALLQRANLPSDFPIHPAARRMPQPPQGGVSYAVNSAVPDVAAWVRDQLRRTGFDVGAAELEGDVEADYKDRWISYGRMRGGARASGWVIVRQVRRETFGVPGVGQLSTEVKVLNEQDERLKPPPTVTPVATPARSS